MTFSLVARSPGERMFGVAIASSSPAVAARCAHGRTGAGAVASQNITDPGLGPRILDALGRGTHAQAALAEALLATPFGAYRQLLAIGAAGPPAVHSGARGLGIVSEAVSADAAAAGNLLAGPAIPSVMIAAFDKAAGHLGDRLLAALRAGHEGGGEAGPVHSAGLLIVRDVSWPIVDLRIDWTDDDPVAALEALWHRYAPQVEDYVQRAIDPSRAPSFGVPGNP
jgi:uncharacterized Ntn-hydrolase superfamily protein